MTKLALSLAVLLGLFVQIGVCADITGKWTADVPGRGGEPQKTTFDLKAEGATLTGTMTSPRGEAAIKEGKVSGDELSFIVPLEFNGNAIKLIFKGKMSGNEIKFTREVEGRDVKSEFTAKRLPS